MFITFETRIGDQVVSQERAVCPPCDLVQEQEVRKLEGIFEATYLGIAALLICGAGYLEYRVVRSARSLLVDRRLLPLTRTLQTEI